MNSKHTKAAIATALLLTGFISPAAAQPVSSNANVDARASASANPFGMVMKQLQSVQERLSAVQERVSGVGPQASVESNASPHSEASNGESNSAKVNHSVEKENGTTTVRHEVTKNGETLVSFVKQVISGEESSNNSSVDSRAELSVTREGEPVENASVGLNGELLGKTDADGVVNFQTEESEEKDSDSSSRSETETRETEGNKSENQDIEVEASAEASLK